MTYELECDAGECWLSVSLVGRHPTETIDNHESFFSFYDGNVVRCHGRISEVLKWFFQMDEKAIKEVDCKISLKPDWIHQRIVDLLSSLGVSYRDNNFHSPPLLEFDELGEFEKRMRLILTNSPIEVYKRSGKSHYLSNNGNPSDQIFKILEVQLDKIAIYSLFMESNFQVGFSDLWKPFVLRSVNELKEFVQKLDKLDQHVKISGVETDEFDINADIWSYILNHESRNVKEFVNDDCSFEVITDSRGQKRIKIASKTTSNSRFTDCVDYIINLYQKYTQEEIISNEFCIKEVHNFEVINKFIKEKKLVGKCFYRICGPRNEIGDVRKLFSEEKPSGNPKKEAPPKNEVYEECTLSSGLHIYVSKGNLIHQRTGAIVNPANSHLRHGGGAAQAIANAAGRVLEEECRAYIEQHSSLPTTEAMHTTAGNMGPFVKYVIHTVGPRTSKKYFDAKDKDELQNQMRKTFYNCLIYANDELHLSSIAIPAVSSGIFGVPIEIVASSMFEAVDIFEQTGGERTLKDIHFVNNDPETVTDVREAFLQWQSGSSVDELTNSRHDDGNDVKELDLESYTTVNVDLSDHNSSNGVSPMDFDDVGALTTKNVKVHASDFRKRGTEDKSTLLGNATKEWSPKEPTPKEQSPKEPSPKEESKNEPDKCVICMDELQKPEKLKCGHEFCKNCLKEYEKRCLPKCPTCGHIFGKIKGNQPSGTMNIELVYSLHLPGYETYSTIMIKYDFPNGRQDKMHPNPGMPYYGTTRKAYLPANDEGKEVALMFKKAFTSKLLFTIGMSHTTGRDNSVVWNDIHQKTSISGQYGYPDPGYLTRVKEEFAAKGIQLGPGENVWKKDFFFVQC